MMSRQHPVQPQRSPHTSPSGKLGSGVLSRPRIPDVSPSLSPGHSPITPLEPLESLADWDDLAPTQPSLPRVMASRRAPLPPTRATTRATISRQQLTIASDFSAYMVGVDWLHAPELAPLRTEQRMRLFSVLASVYLPVLEATGRMEPPGRMEW